MDVKWLDDLEKKVNAATAELESLRKANRTKDSKIKQLQKQLTEAKAADKSASGWEKERDEVRKRVEKLSAGLEKLL